MSTIMRYGKYKNDNITIEEIYNKDPSYCLWLYKQPMVKHYEDIYNFLHEQFKHKEGLIYLTFGKYKNKSVDWIVENDPNYIYYLKSNQYVQTKLKDLAEYVNKINLN